MGDWGKERKGGRERDRERERKTEIGAQRGGVTDNQVWSDMDQFLVSYRVN